MDRARWDDLPLYPDDMAACQRVFDALRLECGIGQDPSMCDLLARCIIAYYRRGVKNEAQLGWLAKSVISDALRQSWPGIDTGRHSL